jgi:hypothetical protein
LDDLIGLRQEERRHVETERIRGLQVKIVPGENRYDLGRHRIACRQEDFADILL